MEGSDLKRALISGTLYFLALFSLGFVLGTIRVMFIAPRLGELAATLAEAPVMLAAAYVFCRWTLRRCRTPRTLRSRWVMVLWFLVLLALFETLLGEILFGRTAADQLAALATPAGLIGVAARISAALLPVFVGRAERS